MATARRIPVEDYKIELTLTPAEAEALFRITGYVIGGGALREATSSVFHALSSAGFKDAESPWVSAASKALVFE